MATASVGLTSSNPLPLGYGYVWVAGTRLQYYMMENTGNNNMDYTRIGAWSLGEGEWDGLIELWDRTLARFLWTEGTAVNTQFHFHPGYDTVIGSGFTPVSNGGDQGVDSFFQYLPAGVQMLPYNRMAYYAIMLKQLINNPPNTHQNDASVWADVDPVGLWRAQKCRIFDASGNLSGYAFTTNPAWHYVDAILRRRLFPEFNITATTGATELTPEIKSRLIWSVIADSAAAYDTILTNGRRQMEGNYLFTSRTSLQSILTTILQNSRSYQLERAGAIAISCDKPRSSVFTFSRSNTYDYSFDDKSVNTASNQYNPTFRDLLVPVAANVASITMADYGNPNVTTVDPHPFLAGDRIVIGGTNTSYDGEWVVNTVPAADGSAIDDVYTFEMNTKGSNFPASIGEGGSIGLVYSRFKQRSPFFPHAQNQLARGAVGINLARQRNKIIEQPDFATMTYDQCARIACYERDRALGLNVTPYITPRAGSVTIGLYEQDAVGSGALAIQIENGDRVTVDDTLDYPYAGDYEVLDASIQPATMQQSNSGGAAAASGGTMTLTLGPYDERYMYTEADPNGASWLNVPGSDPGNSGGFTEVPLADGGFLAFFSGSLSSSQAFQIPSIGIDTANILCWASPDGVIDYGHVMAGMYCTVDPATRIVTLNYTDHNNKWPGEATFFCVGWRSTTSVTKSVVGGITYITAELAGGEIICIGQGILAGDGSATITLPEGFSTANMLATCCPSVSDSTDNDSHGCSCWVDSTFKPWFMFHDGEDHYWYGTANVMVFAFQNNMGTFSTIPITNGTWACAELSTGLTFGIGFANLRDSASFELPYSDIPQTSLQAITSPGNPFDDPGHHAHGVASCYLDGDLIVHETFEDGVDNNWAGNANVFAMIYDIGQTVTTTTTTNSDGTTTTTTTVTHGTPTGGPTSKPPVYTPTTPAAPSTQ